VQMREEAQRRRGRTRSEGARPQASRGRPHNRGRAGQEPTTLDEPAAPPPVDHGPRPGVGERLHWIQDVRQHVQAHRPLLGDPAQRPGPIARLAARGRSPNGGRRSWAGAHVGKDATGAPA